MGETRFLEVNLKWKPAPSVPKSFVPTNHHPWQSEREAGALMKTSNE